MHTRLYPSSWRNTECVLQGTGTNEEMAIAERNHLATEGLVIAAVDVDRSGSSSGPSSRGSGSDTDTDISDEDFSLTRMQGNVRVTTRAMWQGNGALQSRLHKVGPTLSCKRLCTPANGELVGLTSITGSLKMEFESDGLHVAVIICKLAGDLQATPGSWPCLAYLS